MRLGGTVPARAAGAAGARRVQAVAAQPALQRPGGRERLLREPLAQFQAEPARTPARVRAAQL
jgi:hypothetical protein